MGCFFNDNLNVTWDSVVHRCVTFSRNVYDHAFANASRYANFNNFFAFNNTCTLTMLTLMLNNGAFAVTIRADVLRLYHAKHATLCTHYVALAMTRRASFRFRTALTATTATFSTSDILLHLVLLSDTCGNLFER